MRSHLAVPPGIYDSGVRGRSNALKRPLQYSAHDTHDRGSHTKPSPSIIYAQAISKLFPIQDDRETAVKVFSLCLAKTGDTAIKSSTKSRAGIFDPD
jgi:hypothetical protein